MCDWPGLADAVLHARMAVPGEVGVANLDAATLGGPDKADASVCYPGSARVPAMHGIPGNNGPSQPVVDRPG